MLDVLPVKMFVEVKPFYCCIAVVCEVRRRSKTQWHLVKAAALQNSYHSLVVSVRVSFHFRVKMSLGETACSYALLILEDDKIAVTADNITTLLKTANVEVESYWPSLFVKLAEKKNIKDLIASAAGSGAPGAVAATPVAGGGGAAAAAPVVEEKKEEPKEESDDDMGFSLFD